MRRANRILTCCVIVILTTLISCREEKKGPEKYERRSVENKYSLLIPENLQKTDELNDVASIQFQNKEQDFYVIVIDEPKADFYKAVELSTYAATPDIEGYYKVVVNHFREECGIIDFNVSDETKEKVNGAKAITFTMTGEYEEGKYPVFYRYSIIESNKRFYQIMSWTNKTQAEKSISKMNKIINSFLIEENKLGKLKTTS